MISREPDALDEFIGDVPGLSRATNLLELRARISAFYGITIYMYWNEGDHQAPHFHAHHAGLRASISMDGEVLAGHMEGRALGFVREWARLHR